MKVRLEQYTVPKVVSTIQPLILRYWTDKWMDLNFSGQGMEDVSVKVQIIERLPHSSAQFLFIHFLWLKHYTSVVGQTPLAKRPHHTQLICMPEYNMKKVHR
jgi:hypothetical protein